MSTPSDRTSTLTPSQRALLEQRLRGIRVSPRGEGIARRPTEGSHPLSPGQRRLWFLHLLDPGSPLYNVPRAYRLRGPLDAAALRRALGAVVERHAVLRARLVERGGEPEAVVGPAGTARLPVVDLRGVPAALREGEAWRRVREAAARPFRLADEAPLAAWLFRLADDDHVLLLGVHHVAADEWSMRVLARDLSAGYAAALGGGPAALPALPLQYADWAAWERERLDGAGLERPLAWWRGRLAGAPPLDLPGDRPRPPARSFRGGVHAFRLPAGTRERCAELARASRATPFAVLLAAFQLLLHRYTGQDDLVVGSPSAGRTRAELDALVGFFVNTLALRVDAGGDPAFRELLRRAGEAAAGAVAHQDVPFDRLVEELRPERDPSRAPLVQVALAFQNVPGEAPALPGVRAEVSEVDTGTAKFDLTLFLYDEPDGLRGRLEYAADLFDPGTAARLAEHFARLLAGALEAPDRPASALPLLGDGERRRLLEEAHGAARPRPGDASLAELFAARAAAEPDGVAVEHGGERVTRAELHARAGRLARRLAAAGTRPGDRVALLGERSVALVAAMLGVVQAGAAYVPLDPSHPADRLRRIVEDAGARVLVACGNGSEEYEVRSTLHTVGQADGGSPSRTSYSALRTSFPESLAYVVYTSGSTGQPKGVMVPHRAVARLVGCDLAPLGPGDAVAHLSNPAFDAAVWEVWGALLGGARLVVIDREVALAPSWLGPELAERGVTALFLTTALFNLVAREAPGALAPVRHVVFGGEAADPHAVRAVLRGGAPERLLNAYGPTEAAVFATFHRVESLAEDAASVPIGRSLAGDRAYVLDGHGEPVPAGVPGELCLGGDGLGWGYLGRPELTAGKFVPDPFGGEAGARLYRTGDLVRRRADGALEHLGRLDGQVKLRGFRIEPAEIEAALAAHPAVGEAVVVVRGDGGDRRLAAYLVPAPGAAPTAAELRDHLAARLPAYMVPASFTALDVVPVTSSGKTDRRALPAPEAAAAGSEAPRDMLEHQVAALWEELLGSGPVGIRDDFFELGGHSLLAVRMLGRVEERFGRRVPLSALFAGATVEGLAAALRRDSPAGAAEDVVTLNPRGTRPPIFFLHGDVGGGGLYGLALARFLGTDQPLHLLPPLRPEPGGAGPGIRDMARRHLEVVRRVQPSGPYRLGGYCNGGLAAFETARLLEAAGERVERLLVVQASAEAAYYRGALRVAALVGRLLRRSAEDRADRLVAAADYLRDFNRELRAHASRGAAEVASLLWRKAGRRLRRDAVRPAPVPPTGAGPASAEESERGLRVRHMLRAVRGYLPGRYGGGVTLFWTEESHPLPGDDTMGWSKVARRVEVVPIRGTHDSSVSVHLEDLAARISACLGEE